MKLKMIANNKIQITNYKHDIRNVDAFTTGAVQLKKPLGGPQGLIGSPCHGAGVGHQWTHG